MSDEIKSILPAAPESEPAASRSVLPIWIVVLTLLLIFIGGWKFDDESGWFAPQVYGPFGSVDQVDQYQPKSGAAAVLAHGKVVYDQVCGLCHNPDGTGKAGQAPPLAGSEWVNTKGFSRLAHIPLAGLAGNVSVEGKDWNLSMAAMGAALSDADLAAVLSYVRSSWGNKAGPVTADDIHGIRTTMGAHPTPISGDQLKTMAE